MSDTYYSISDHSAACFHLRSKLVRVPVDRCLMMAGEPRVSPAERGQAGYLVASCKPHETTAKNGRHINVCDNCVHNVILNRLTHYYMSIILHRNRPNSISRPYWHDHFPRNSYSNTFSETGSLKLIAVISKLNIFKKCLIRLSNVYVRQTTFHVSLATVRCSLAEERERERLSLSVFLRTEDIGVHIVHISRLIITYTLE